MNTTVITNYLQADKEYRQYRATNIVLQWAIILLVFLVVSVWPVSMAISIGLFAVGMILGGFLSYRSGEGPTNEKLEALKLKRDELQIPYDRMMQEQYNSFESLVIAEMDRRLDSDRRTV